MNGVTTEETTTEETFSSSTEETLSSSTVNSNVFSSKTRSLSCVKNEYGGGRWLGNWTIPKSCWRKLY